MPAIVPRWEWRTFGNRFPEIEARVAATPHDRRTSREIYIVSAASDANVKIRAELLDVKLLQQVDGDLELWSPALKTPFPIDRGVCDAVFGFWRTPPPGLDRPSYTLDQFLEDVVARAPQLTVCHVTKERHGLDVGGCLVELAVLEVDGRRIETVAVEHEDPERVRRVVRALGLEGLDNVNYIHALKALRGAAVS